MTSVFSSSASIPRFSITSKLLSSLLVMLFYVASCSSPQRFQEAKVQHLALDQNAVKGGTRSSAKLEALLAPYRKKVDSIMALPLCTAAVDISKGKGENELGNLCCDLLLSAANRLANPPCQLSLLASGGLRIGLSKGIITQGTVFELSPFENELVALQLTGSQLMEVVALHAKQNHLNISGAIMRVSKAGQHKLFIGGEEVKPDQLYWLATIDYLADGGDNLSMLKNAKERVVLGQKMRDAFISEMALLDTAGKQLNPKLEGRIVSE